MRETVVLFDGLAAEQPLLKQAAAQFGWSLKVVKTVGRLRDVGLKTEVVAVLCDLSRIAGRWNDALQAVREAVPEALPILCQRFSDTMIWPDLADAGAFHSVSLPLNPHEVRQSLGFVWAARHARPAEPAAEAYTVERGLAPLAEPLAI